MGQGRDVCLAALRRAYRDDALDPAALIDELLAQAAAAADRNIWIRLLSRAELEPLLARLRTCRPEMLPLYGVPFAIKDNIDLAQVPTTAGCPAYAYTPSASAGVVQRLIDAGAIPLGKTNLDQFATGLNGTRSPYGAVPNSFDVAYIAGGSSSGSAAAVAAGQASFALGTDTAGSGRVPAALNNLLGVKPSCGLVSTRGVVPACRSLDCVSLFALNPDDAGAVLQVMAGFDAADPFARVVAPAAPFARRVLGVPRVQDLAFFDYEPYARCYAATLARIAALGYTLVEVDLQPFLAAARLLYHGPWVAERYLALREFLAGHAGQVHPVVRKVVEQGAAYSAADAFAARHELAALKRSADAILAGVDAVLTPTIGRPFRIDELLQQPIELNSALGYYTNFMNLLDYAALALPAGFTAGGLPFGVTLFAAAGTDQALLELGRDLLPHDAWPMGATGHLWRPAPRTLPAGDDAMALVVCGAHMSGLPLSHQLTGLGATLLRRTRTAPCYRLYALPGGPPRRPGLERVRDGGAAIEVEVWRLPRASFGAFLAGIPAPLSIGSIELAEGGTAPGFLCEHYGLDGARDITAFGGWRRFLAAAG